MPRTVIHFFGFVQFYFQNAMTQCYLKDLLNLLFWHVIKEGAQGLEWELIVSTFNFSFWQAKTSHLYLGVMLIQFAYLFQDSGWNRHIGKGSESSSDDSDWKRWSATSCAVLVSHESIPSRLYWADVPRKSVLDSKRVCSHLVIFEHLLSTFFATVSNSFNAKCDNVAAWPSFAKNFECNEWRIGKNSARACNPLLSNIVVAVHGQSLRFFCWKIWLFDADFWEEQGV